MADSVSMNSYAYLITRLEHVVFWYREIPQASWFYGTGVKLQG